MGRIIVSLGILFLWVSGQSPADFENAAQTIPPEVSAIKRPGDSIFDWEEYAKPAINADRICHSTLYDNDSHWIFMIGGTPDGGGGSNLNLIYVYYPSLDTWDISLTPMPTARSWIQGGYWDRKIYVAGGYSSSGTCLTAHELYEIDIDTWTSLAPMPEARMAYGAVVWNGNMYIIGGIGPSMSSGTQTVFRFDLAGGGWSLATPLPQEFDMGGVTILNNDIYIIGGYNRSAGQLWTNLYKGTINPSDPDDITWSTEGSLINPVLGNCATISSGKIYSIGGFLNGTQCTDEIWEFDPSGGFTVWGHYPVPIARGHFFTGTEEYQYLFYGVAGDAYGNWSPPNDYYYRFFIDVVDEKDSPVESSISVLSLNPTITARSATLRFSLKYSSVISISVYNSCGQLVKSVRSPTRTVAGDHSVHLLLDVFPEGTYFVCLSTDEKVHTEKLIIAR